MSTTHKLAKGLDQHPRSQTSKFGIALRLEVWDLNLVKIVTLYTFFLSFYNKSIESKCQRLRKLQELGIECDKNIVKGIKDAIQTHNINGKLSQIEFCKESGQAHHSSINAGSPERKRIDHQHMT